MHENVTELGPEASSLGVRLFVSFSTSDGVMGQTITRTGWRGSMGHMPVKGTKDRNIGMGIKEAFEYVLLLSLPQRTCKPVPDGRFREGEDVWIMVDYEIAYTLLAFEATSDILGDYLVMFVEYRGDLEV
eukprot:1156746-Pelagomonas_calceolata.AAC.3